MALIKCKECGEVISKKAKQCPKCGAPGKKKTSLFTWIVTIVFGLLLIGYISAPTKDPSKEPELLAQDLGITKPTSIELTAAEAASMTDVIQRAGFNCPAVKLAWLKGQDVRGIVFKAFCGPADREGSWLNFVFRVTLRPDGRYLVEPWG